MKSGSPASLAVRTALLCALAQCVGCAESSAEHQDMVISLRERNTIAESAIAQDRLQSIRKQFRWPTSGNSILAPETAIPFELLDGARIKPRFGPAHQMARFPEIELPANAQRPAYIEDLSSRIGISFAIHGAKDVPAMLAENIAWYDGAGEQGEALFFRVNHQGIEDFAFFNDKPDHETLRYDVDLRGAAGLRLVSNTLELLDNRGAPRLRVVSPYVLEAAQGNGTPRLYEARLTLAGCSADTRSAPPWGRPLTRPCASPPCRCEIQISWDGMGVKYPAMVDPAWTTTRSMSKPRVWATATPLPDEQVIVIGGQSASVPLKTSEIFDPKDGGTWAAGPEMMATRTQHTATPLLEDGRIAVVGGQSASSPRTIEVLQHGMSDPDLVFVPQCELFYYRSQHATALLSNQRILVVGGKNADSSTHIDAEMCDLGPNPYCTPAGALKYPRYAHSATTLRNDVVLVVGGLGPSNETQQTAEWFDSAMKSHETAPPHMAHPYPQATLLPNGRLLVTGSTPEIFSWPEGDEFPTAGSNSWHSDSQSHITRQGHRSTLLPNGKVLITGGYATADPHMDELFDPDDESWSTLPQLLEPRKGHVAAVAGDYVLVAGGTNGSSVLASAEVLRLRPNGADCVANAECSSGYCVDGRCCNTACRGECYACSALETGLEVDGHCGMRLSNKCGGYACGPSGDCRTSCTVDDECARLYICESDQCVQAPLICAQGVRRDRRGERFDDCGVYTCKNTIPGECHTSCSHGSHCHEGLRCVLGQCIQDVKPPTVDQAACHCNLVGTGEPHELARAAWVVLLFGYRLRRRQQVAIAPGRASS